MFLVVFFWFLQVGNVLLLMRFLLKNILWIFLYQAVFLTCREIIVTEISALDGVSSKTAIDLMHTMVSGQWKNEINN